MPGAQEHILLGAAAKRALVVAEDQWLRFRLQHALEHAGCDVASVALLDPGAPPRLNSFDVVLADATGLAEEKAAEVLRAYRKFFPKARLVLLAGQREGPLAEQARASGFDLVLPRPRRVDEIGDIVWESLAVPRAAAGGKLIPIKFELIEELKGSKKRGAGSAFTSLLVHALVLTVVLLVPLAYTETLDVRALTSTWLMAPPPPPPPPPPPASVLKQLKRLKPVFTTPTGKLVAPRSIPKEIVMLSEHEELDSAGGVIGGVPGGVPGGQMGGVIGGVIGGVLSSVPRPAPPPVPLSQAVRVGGKIRPPRLVRRVDPIYPDVAKQARIQGDVRIDAIIDTQGRVVEMKVLSGHPLLATSALNAVGKWVYEPTYLNEQPIPVVLEVTVEFRLH
jgi:protein TonB